MGVLSFCLSVAALAAVGAADEPRAGSSRVELVPHADCEVGDSPTHPNRNHPPETFLRYGTRPVVIGCAELASGPRFELVRYQLRHGEQSALCVDHYDFETGVTSGCGSNVVNGDEAIDATSTEHTAVHVPVVAGTTASSVARVVVRSEVDGRLRRHPAVLVKVRDPELLRMIGVRKGFGRYLAEVSHGARAASAEALGARGRTGSPFPGFRGPVGEGRRCYSQPRVARLRLLGRARVDETSQVRVVAIYPGGYIGSIDVSVGGRGGAMPISSTPAPVARARRVVTIPVHFTRRGATGLDVTAEGLPLSRRCGDRPLLRHSAPKTLVVQVRQRPHAHGLIGCYRASPEMSPRPCKQARRYPARGVPVLTESRRFTYRRRFRKSLIAVVRSARIGDTSGDGIAAEGSPSAREQPARV